MSQVELSQGKIYGQVIVVALGRNAQEMPPVFLCPDLSGDA
jgi:hypothetical protein